MKYFIVRQDSQMSDIAYVINGANDIDTRHIRPEKAHLIQRRTLLMCRPSQRLIFPDVYTSPFLMFSSELRQIVSIYQKDILYKEIVLLEQGHSLTAVYYMPILPILDCVANPYRFEEGTLASRKPVLDHSKCKHFSAFKFQDIRRIHTVMSLELLESILIRKCVGLAFEQVEVV